MSHYKTLGVASDATADEIKTAYRRCARKAHPDQGGNDAEMAAINRAYEVLGDAERRSNYDATGQDSDQAAEIFDQHVKALLMELFDSVLESEDRDPLAAAHRTVRDGYRAMGAEVASAEKKMAKLRARRNRLRARSGENLFQGMVDAQIAEQQGRIDQAAQTRKVLDAVKAALENYEAEEPTDSPIYTDGTRQKLDAAIDRAILRMWSQL